MIKRGIAILFALLLCVSPLPIQANSETQISAAYAYAVDLQTMQVLYERNADEKMYPASMTKVLTVLTAMDQIDDLDEEVTITLDMLSGLEDGTYTLTGFLAKEVVTMRDLLYGAMLPSGADACQALAVALYGSEEAMVEAMNAKANELGMTHSHFTNTVGMHDEQHYTTAEDLAVLMKAAWNNADIRTAMSTKKYATSSSYYHGDGISLKNTWALEQQAAGIEDGHILGGKTGYTPEASYCFFGVCEIDELPVIVIVAKTGGDTDDFGRASMQDVEAICTSIEQNKQPVLLAKEGETIGTMDLRRTFADPIVLKAPFDLYAWEETSQDLQLKCVAQKEEAPIQTGEIIAQAQIADGEKTLASVALYATEDVDSELFAIIVEIITGLLLPLIFLIGIIVFVFYAWQRKKKLR